MRHDPNVRRDAKPMDHPAVRRKRWRLLLSSASLLLSACAPSSLPRVSQTSISSAYTRSDLAMAATRDAVPVVLFGVLPSTVPKQTAEAALLAALPRTYVAGLKWRSGTPEDNGVRLVFAFGGESFFPPDRLCGLPSEFRLTSPSPSLPVQIAAAYCRGPSALASTVGDVIDPAGVTGERTASLIGFMANDLLPQHNPNDDFSCRRFSHRPGCRGEYFPFTPFSPLF